MKYIGKIQRVEVTEKKDRKHFDWLKLIIWYIGVIISFVPIFIEALIYLASNATLDKKFAMKVCTKGDVLWILATLLILTLVECYIEADKLVGFKKWIGVLGVVAWGLCCAIWIVFKYIYPENYNGNVVFWICGIIGSVVIVICSTLQLGVAEVEK
ncbi:MAG: hypothetical protein K2O59_03510 [Lachnospiraceae bacterium]|nr:hypothetical protein [Lachnospiraceae bacterium]